MFVDASAIVAILTDEPEAEAFQQRISDAALALCSPMAIYEAVLGVARKKAWPVGHARTLVMRWAAAAEIRMVPIDDAERDTALDAFGRYGKGLHEARLNMGDCFAYACAKVHGVPLLYKGDDFRLTDIPAA